MRAPAPEPIGRTAFAGRVAVYLIFVFATYAGLAWTLNQCVMALP